jgi:hypothetical protein
VRELERERVTVQQAAARLGITESAVRKRVRKGDLRSEKVLEGNKERLYVFLDPDAEPFPEPFREKYMRSLEDRVKTLEDEVMRQQAIILSMSQSLRALTGAPAAPQGVEEAQEEGEPHSGTEDAKREPTRPPATSVPTSRLGMSSRVVFAVGAIATLLTWINAASGIWDSPVPFFSGGYSFASLISTIVLLPMLVPLLSGLWAGFTKRPLLPWFSSPRRWLRRGGRSVLEIATFTTGMPALVAWWVVGVSALLASALPKLGLRDFVFLIFLTLVAFAVASLAFMSGALLGNALRRVGFLGRPKELPQGEEGDQEEAELTTRQQVLWGVAGSIIAALISALASIVAASIGN